MDVMLVNYIGKFHTSLVVDDPLIGDYSFCYDIDRIIANNVQKKRDNNNLKNHTKKGSEPHVLQVTREDATLAPAYSARNGTPLNEGDLVSYVHPLLISIAQRFSPF